MATFDREKRPTEISPEIMDEINALVDRLQARKVAEIKLPEPPLGLRVPNLVRCYLQAHLRRCLTFLDGGVVEIEAGRPLVAELCSRAIYENIAVICDFTETVKPLLDGGDYAGVEKVVTQSAFVTRIPSFLEKHGDEIKAPQILNLIDKLKKRAPTFREEYDHLSDIVHPNGLGAVVYFTKIENAVATFADAGNNPERARTSLIVAALLLAHVELAIDDTEQRLKKLSAEIVAKNASSR